MRDNTKTNVFLYILGIIPVVWIALLLAPFVTGGLVEIVKEFPNAINNPLRITLCENSIRVIFLFLFIYAMGISIYESTKKNYRRREEHGSAKWGNVNQLNKKYKQNPISENKILTQNVAIGLDGRKHRRNLNVLVIGGSGAGKTRFYGKPNVMQCGNSSYVILDPKRRNTARYRKSIREKRV